MGDLPESLFANPVWHALHSRHRHFARCVGDACRYPAEVAPFVAVAGSTKEALERLRSLLIPGEPVWLLGEGYLFPPDLAVERTIECLQMVLPRSAVVEDRGDEIVPLSEANAGEMVALTNVAFPGFYRPRTHEMGSYYGIRSGGELVAMAGERFQLDGFPEISGVCTHPAHRGKGLAASLISQLARDHRRDGLASWLHVETGNPRAIELYLRMGFRTVRKVQVQRIARIG